MKRLTGLLAALSLSLALGLAMMSTGVQRAHAEETVTIPDAALAAAVRAELGLPAGEPITVADMQSLTSLDFDNKGITDLTGLEQATNLESLVVRNNPLANYDALSGLASLRFLDVSYSGSHPDISALTPLTGLTELRLEGTGVTDMTQLTGFTGLTFLCVAYCGVTDVTPLAALTNLEGLCLLGDHVSDIASLAPFTNLTYLDVRYNRLLLHDGSPARAAIASLTAKGANVPWKTMTDVFRFYNTKAHSHFYTASVAERQTVFDRWSSIFSYDGTAYSINTSDAWNSQHLWRFYNVKTGSHFYTASEDEKNTVLATWPDIYQLDGPAYDVCPTPVPGATTVYRFYNKINGTHFYTASEDEKNTVLAMWPDIYQLDGPAYWLAP